MKLRLAASGENEYGTWKQFERVMTNADRIRAMSDEELSRFIDSLFEGHRGCPDGAWNRCVYPDNTCQDCWLRWLKQEVDT